MAISWGSGSGSGNLHYVGIDVALSGTTATVKLYVRSQYSVSDNQRLTWSNAASGYADFYHNQSGGSAVLVKTLTITGSNSQSKTISASLSGVYNGASPSHSVTFTFPPPDVLVPYTPTGFTSTRVSDTTVDHKWDNAARTPSWPVDRYRLERYDYANPSAGWVLQTTTTALSVRTTNNTSNNRYKYRVQAENSAGRGGYSTETEVITTPRAPSGVNLARLASGSLELTWTDWSPHNTHWEIQYKEGSGSYGSTISLLNSATSHQKASPDPMVSHQARMRSMVNGLVSAWVESGVLTLLTKPNPPTALTGGVADPTKAITVSWKHNTTDGSAQTARQLRWRAKGSTGAYTEGSQDQTSSQSAVVAANTWTWDGTPNAGIELQVRTKGQHADWSDWSATSTWTWAGTPVVALVKPTQGYVQASPTLNVDWTSSEPQGFFRAVLYDSAGTTLETASGSTSVTDTTFKTKLTTANTYQVMVELRSSAGLWADPVDATFTTAFPVPALVRTSVSWDAVRGWAVCGFQAEPAREYAWTGTPHASTSTMTVEGETFTNLATNPSFEGEHIPEGATVITEWSVFGSRAIRVPPSGFGVGPFGIEPFGTELVN